MRTKLHTILFLFIAILFIGCGESHNNHYAIVLREKREAPKVESKESKVDETLLKANQVINEKEIQQIKGYVERRNWKMTQLKVGVFVEELEKGQGEIINSNSIVKLDCKIVLLDEKIVFDSKKDGERKINMGKEQSVIGLVYALEGKAVGSKLRVAIPSFLAYGLIGDGEKIPKRASLVYEIEIKDVN
ncbi:MAG: FKBP-type peptidyl-prolyl cis-trans isomerase [Bacteroidales bacterium]|nr:FKBP-type peptidyl-prolyl cis-trans isomerase [Bacteroidales bacterium]